MESSKKRGKAAFRRWLNYLHGQVLDFKKMEEDGVLEDYYAAMGFVSEFANRGEYSPFYKYHAELLLLISSNPGVSTAEAALMSDITTESAARRIAKLVDLGYVYSFKEKNRETRYNLTPHGKKFLTYELVENPNSVLYDEE